MERRGMERFAPLAGVVFLVLAVISGVLAGDTPDFDEPAVEHATFFAENDGRQFASAVIGALASVALVWFAGSLRDAIARVEPEHSRLASIAFGGSVILATGLLILSGIQFAAADSAREVSPEVTQTLSVLGADLFFPVAGGTALLAFASGLAGLRYGAFDRRLAIIAMIIGVLAITPAGFFAFIAFLIWAAIAGVLLYRKKDPVGSGAAESPLPPA